MFLAKRKTSARPREVPRNIILGINGGLPVFNTCFTQNKPGYLENEKNQLMNARAHAFASIYAHEL